MTVISLPLPEAARPPDPAITRLQLVGFRNYLSLDLALTGRHVVLTGENGAGKTNLMEAVSLLAPGRGLRRARLDDMTRQGAEGWTVSLLLSAGGDATRIGFGLDRGEEGESQRRIRVDGTPLKVAEDLTEHAAVLWLTPAMDGLFSGPAGDRRRFLDRLVQTLDPGHGSRVAAFERAMRGRNRLLEDDRWDTSWLSAIETQMAELAVAISAARLQTVGCLTHLIEAGHDDASPFPNAVLALEGTLEVALAGGTIASLAEDDYRAGLVAMRARDKAAGRTIDGPHRADLKVEHGPKAMPAELSSTGEQKALLIGLILAQARLVAATRRRPPLLLLDEIAAHLDGRRRAALFEIIDSLGGQCWMTGTDVDPFRPLADRADMIAVTAGTARPIG